MSDKELVTFTVAVEVKDHNGAVEFSADVGDCKELVKTSAARWVGRRKAVYGKLDVTQETSEAPDAGDNEAELKKAVKALTKAKERYQTAFTAHQKKADAKTTKELGLASKHQENKQQEYDTLVAVSEKE